MCEFRLSNVSSRSDSRSTDELRAQGFVPASAPNVYGSVWMLRPCINHCCDSTPAECEVLQDLGRTCQTAQSF